MKLLKVVLPRSFHVASIVLGISRAIGETMIVSAAGSSPTASLNLTNSIQTMTGYIVEVATGDATFGSDMYYSIYAVGFTLFIFTLIMNLISYWISKRFRESINMTATNPKAKTLIDKVENISSRGKTNKLNKWLFFTCIVIALLVLAALLIQTFVKGVGLHQISLQILLHLHKLR